MLSLSSTILHPIRNRPALRETTWQSLCSRRGTAPKSCLWLSGKCWRSNGLVGVFESHFRLLDHWRTAQDEPLRPRKTFTTGFIFHSLRRISRILYVVILISWLRVSQYSQDVALASLFVSTKMHDTLKKPRDLQSAWYNVQLKLKNPAAAELDIDSVDPLVSVLV